jgi:hypothetical protein
MVRYCSVECQKAAWSEHKKCCQPSATPPPPPKEPKEPKEPKQEKDPNLARQAAAAQAQQAQQALIVKKHTAILKVVQQFLQSSEPFGVLLFGMMWMYAKLGRVLYVYANRKERYVIIKPKQAIDATATTYLSRVLQGEQMVPVYITTHEETDSPSLASLAGPGDERHVEARKIAYEQAESQLRADIGPVGEPQYLTMLRAVVGTDGKVGAINVDMELPITAEGMANIVELQ